MLVNLNIIQYYIFSIQIFLTYSIYFIFELNEISLNSSFPNQTYFPYASSCAKSNNHSHDIFMQRIRNNFRFQSNIRQNIHLQRDCSQLTEKYRRYPITSGIIFLAERKVVPSLICAVTKREREVLVPLVNLSSLFYTCSLTLFIFKRYFGSRRTAKPETLPVARPSRFNGGNNPWKTLDTPWGILRGISD